MSPSRRSRPVTCFRRVWGQIVGSCWTGAVRSWANWRGGFKVPAGVRCAFATVLAIVAWDRERSDPDYRDGLRCDSWEVVVPELVFEPDD